MTKATIEHLNPEGLHKSPVFSQAIAVSGGRTLYIGGQDGVDADGQVVADTIEGQAARAIANVRACLQAAGGDLEHLVKVTIHLVAGQQLEGAFGAWQQAFAGRGPPPTVTMLFVAALGHPAWLIEIDAIAVLPERG